MSIIIKNISFTYESQPVLNNISLEVKAGEHIGIIGESGCGKTTLLKLLSGLYENQSGFLSVGGETEPEKIRKQVAMVMQTGSLFPTSIWENITCGHDTDGTWEKDMKNVSWDDRVRKACKAAQLSDWIDTLPEGLQTYVGERGNKVSGGQAQRIAIARAIVKDAPVVLLDEVTSALDEKTESSLLEALKPLIVGKAVINVSHRKNVLKECDRIFRMDCGKLTLVSKEVI